ncbi:uncharacterized protein BDR25DRAFT_382499 [Lindgomyces ingoldianus]|uniref:Uncharacterized protein n=1 Tax=Lindgomyces ingoldianus TaxID=673940 RepID=A0ACB6R852_9PLEO|nr:uncharacterized protein BDR25DRAFT_382499 [Lindgomyces ingoldianus]KAF2475488.1 hypothetical protein BDR25DRAFT_382499 [Lindgomyces ingoldianus]
MSLKKSRASITTILVLLDSYNRLLVPIIKAKHRSSKASSIYLLATKKCVKLLNLSKSTFQDRNLLVILDYTKMNPTLHSALQALWTQVHSPAGLSFPLTLAKLSDLNVTRYRVDYITRTITTYTSSALSPSSQLPSPFDISPFPQSAPHTYPLNKPWNKDGVVKAIRKAQAGEGNYLGFSEEVVQAGVTDYTAYVEGKRVVYCGALGEVHVEWFPGAGPEQVEE